jgi:hypothetical protein
MRLWKWLGRERRHENTEEILLMALIDTVKVLNDNIAELNGTIASAVTALQGTQIPAGLDQTLADAGAAVKAANDTLKAAVPV